MIKVKRLSMTQTRFTIINRSCSGMYELALTSFKRAFLCRGFLILIVDGGSLHAGDESLFVFKPLSV